KLITQKFAQNPEYFRAFQREVQAISRLRHSHIIPILDFGRVPDGAESVSGGQVDRRSPYYVMPLGTGTMADWRGRLTWREACEVLLGVLDGLAFSHAKGVIHRDIKASNLLLLDTPSGRNLALVDFGVAHAVERRKPSRSEKTVEGTHEFPNGTPTHMAPEQFRGKWRDYGPWTDLYSVGITAIELLAGAPPRSGLAFVDYAVSHLNDEFELETSTPVPDAFHRWLSKLLAKEPTQRFQHCVDAALELVAMRDSWEHDQCSEPFLPGRVSCWPVFDRKLEQVPEGARLGTFGAGVVSLRTPKLIGRDREMELLEVALTESERGSPRFVAFSGDPGTGKSRLCDSVATLAAYRGFASVHRVRCHRDAAPGSALQQMVTDLVQGNGLPPTQLRGRLESQFGVEIDAALLAPANAEESREIPPAVRYAAIERLLSTARRLPVSILWLDDIHVDADAIQFVRFLHARSRLRPWPVLCIFSTQSTGDLKGPGQSLLRDMASWSNAAVVEIGRLSDALVAELVADLLPMDSSVVSTVAERAAGNALVALQIVASLVNARELRQHGGLFRMEGTTVPEFPNSGPGLWGKSIEALGPQGSAIRHLLVLLAALDGALREAELVELCRMVGIEFDSAGVGQALRLGILTSEADGLRIAHRLLSESVIQAARESESWRVLNRIAADFLELRPGLVHGRRELRATCLVESGDPTRAAVLLLDVAEDRRRTGDLLQADDLLNRLEHVLEYAGLSSDDPIRLESQIARVNLERLRWNMPEARRLALDVVSRTEVRGWTRLSGRAHLALAQIGAVDGDETSFEEHLCKARSIFLALGDEYRMHISDHTRAIWLRTTGRFDEAERLYLQALEGLEQLGDLATAAQGRLGVAHVCLMRGDYERAEQLYESLLDTLSITRKHDAMSCINGLGEVARRRGDLLEATRRYRETARLAQELGVSELIPLINLGITELACRQTPQARDAFEQASLQCTPGGVHEGMVELGLACCEFGDGNREAGWSLLSRATGPLSSIADPDIAWLFERAMQIALEQG
ncbi:MAG: tetratricopeptide repeat protein, partial [Myxococcales bacterium]|nr:tetratricopeptide repeat protein [Myxococcales bacterium]